MKASELRIGNWVTINNPKAWLEMKGKPLQVEGVENRVDDSFPKSTGSVSLTDNDWQTYNQFDEFIEPIPLTEEWLLKFRFGKSDEHEMGHNIRDDFHFYYDYHFKKFRIESGHAKRDNYFQELPIQFIHQIQNLFHSLTGQELTIQK